MRFGLILALIASLALSACGGGASTSSTTGAVVPAAGHAVPASVVITIPARPAGNAKPAYVSPSTQSVSIAVSPATGCTGCSSATTITANVTASSPGCTNSGGATTCTIPFQLNPGSYTGNVTTYDQTGEAGNQLSSNQSVPFTIVVNTANVIQLALSGIPASLTLSLTGTPPATLASGTLTIDGAGTTVTLSATTKDADGNTIVGAGAPTIASAAVTGNTGYTTQTSGSTFTLTTPAKGSRTAGTITVTLSAPNCPGAAACTAQISANMTEFIAVTQLLGNLTQVYSERTQTWTAGVAGSKPYALAFDSKGDMFVANQNGNSVTEYAPPYTGSPITTLSGTWMVPDSLALDSNNNLYVGAQQGIGPIVLEYAPPYTGTPTSITGPFNNVSQLLVDSNNNLWVTNNVKNQDVYLFPAPVTPSNSTAIPITQCNGITEDGANDVDISCANNLIYAYTTAGSLVNTSNVGETFGFLYPYPGGGLLDVIASQGGSVTAAAYLNYQANTLNTIDTNGATPVQMGFDANKLMYVLDIGNGTVATLPYPYTGTAQLLQSGLNESWAIAVWP
jgi:hypothetical protein